LDAKEIRELIELISASNFATFELEGEGYRLKLVKEQPAAAPAVAAPATAPAAVRVDAMAAPAPAEPAAGSAAAVEAGHEAVLSPIVGTFYRAATPDAAPFVEVGTKISKGQVLCIVEAMKVMNEIESEIDAEVVDVFVANGQPVEYGEMLFHLRPLN